MTDETQQQPDPNAEVQVDSNAVDFDNVNNAEDNIDKYIRESIEAQDGKKEDTGQETPSAQAPSTQGEKKTAEPTGKQPVTNDNGSGQQNVAQSGEKSDSAGERKRYAEDEQGNLIGTDGKIVATAGDTRRHFERAERAEHANNLARRHIGQLERDLQQAKASQAGDQYLNGLPTQLGVNQQEVMAGLQIVAQWKKDPTAAIKYLLTEYAAMGHNVNELLGKEGGIDMAAVNQAIQNAVSPLVQDRSQQQRIQEVNVAAEREYTAFMAKYPEAATHENDIAALMQAERSMTAETALYRLKSWALENGLDFTRPLRPQIEAGAQQGAPQQGQSQPRPPVQGSQAPQQMTQPPIPNGRGSPQTVVQQHKTNAPADSDWDSIIREELQRSNINA